MEIRVCAYQAGEDWLRSRKLAYSAAVALQIVLGISTLLMRVPVALGALHQGGAVVLLTAALFANYRLRNPSYRT